MNSQRRIKSTVGASMSDILIKRLRERLGDPERVTDGTDVIKPRIYQPVTSEVLDSAERRLGFKLPQLLRRIYTEVANGGFGPSYGLLGICGGAANEDRRDSVELYEWFRKARPDDDHWHWPERLLPLGHLGCAMFCCADCSSETTPIIWFEPNPHEDGEPWTDCFIPFAESLGEWLTAWLDGEADDMFEIAWKRKFGDQALES